MVAHVSTVAFQGIDVVDVGVQVQMSSGLPAFTIVGLPDKAVAESRERVRAALNAVGLSLPPKRITVNLAPASLAKEGSYYDLPIALGRLVDMDVVAADDLADYCVLGELGLDGSIAPVAGVLLAVINAAAGHRGLICPAASGGEAPRAGEIDILAAPDVLSLINHLKGTPLLPRREKSLAREPAAVAELSDIKGQEIAKRALEVAAAGGHNLLMIGPPGAGKSMLAADLAGILPPLDAAETLEVSMIQSAAGSIRGGQLTRQRPFRDPHHSASLAALVGGGQQAKPGEVTLAHLGVLFLDELPKFARNALEALRQPIESGRITVSRANAHVTYPARVQLVAAMNPCRCGYLTIPCKAAAGRRNAASSIRARSQGRCSTASIFTSRWRQSRPPISVCRRRLRAAPRWPPGSRPRVRSNCNAMRVWRVAIASSAPMPKPTAISSPRLRRRTTMAYACLPKRPITSSCWRAATTGCSESPVRWLISTDPMVCAGPISLKH